MKNFKEFIEESRALEIVHKNPSISAVKNLSEKTGRLRFVVSKDGTTHFGNAHNFTHTDLNPNHSEWHMWGNVFHNKGNHIFNIDNKRSYKGNHTDHPLIKKFIKHGFIDDSN